MNLKGIPSCALDLGDQAEQAAELLGRFPRDIGAVTEQVTPRHVEPEDWLRFQQSIAEILTAFGMNLDARATERTPERLLKALYDAASGYDGDHSRTPSFCLRGASLAGCSRCGAPSRTSLHAMRSPSRRWPRREWD